MRTATTATALAILSLAARARARLGSATHVATISTNSTRDLGPGSADLRAAVDAARATAGVVAAIDSPYLEDGALAESIAACARAAGDDVPAPSFDRETSVRAVHVTGTSALADGAAAVQDAVDGFPFAVRTGVVDAGWDRKGAATHRCPGDGLLYATIVLSDFVTAPRGRYIDPVFEEEDIAFHNGVRYGNATLCVNQFGNRTGNDLLMDVYEPTGDNVALRPAMVVIHGGGFISGNRRKNAKDAAQYALRGYVVAAIQYRTCPKSVVEDDDEAKAALVRDAIDDGMEAIRFLRANADRYGIDPDRVGAVGNSAGGTIAYGAGLLDDPSPGGPHAAFPHRPTAVMGNGATITAAIDDPGFRDDPAPVMMFRYEVDGKAYDKGDENFGWEYAYEACLEVHGKGVACDFFRIPGVGHSSGLGPERAFAEWYMPWFYEKMDLANVN